MLCLKLAIFVSISAVNAAEIESFISNGAGAMITEFPFLVSIQQINVHICGGSLLNEKWILSSTRCYLTRNIDNLSIEYGNTEITPGLNGSNKPRISQIILHEKYGVPTAMANDISLIESDRPIVTGLHQPFAKLPVPGNSEFISGTASVHAGWGHVLQNVRTNVLQKANVNILSFDECVEAVGNTEKPGRSNICAIGDSVTCAGDLGKKREQTTL
jgi:secreted trypsin-like serine protease